LIKERLEQMIIPLVDDGDVNIGTSERLGRRETAKTGTNNDNAFFGQLCRCPTERRLSQLGTRSLRPEPRLPAAIGPEPSRHMLFTDFPA
jgi:hypothetical protein